MNLRKVEPEDFSSFKDEIERNRNAVERTLNLAWFYVQARFKLSEREFKNYYSVDGANDGGIDFFYTEGNTFYIIQSRYHERCIKEKLESITHEIQKIEKTIIGQNTNRFATDFVNGLRRAINNPDAYLKIIWLTTNEVSDKTRKEAQAYLDEVLKQRQWQLSADINFIDRYALESVVYDIKHSYVPHTGKKEILYEPDECMIIDKGRNDIESVVCNTQAINILNWFSNTKDISGFLQKNVRESVGENKINKAIRDSFKNDPSLFWYKHNGIIIFVDWMEVKKRERKIVVRNPQIVNGAQTISQLFAAYNEDLNHNNVSKLLVRIYRLPYEDSETYKRSIDIIAALNSQNKIKASDLHSTDPRQVMLENRIDELNSRYQYFRKRTDSGKVASPSNVFITKLALHFHSCEYKKPDEGIAGAIESYFEEDRKYDQTFPEHQIKKPVGDDIKHIVFRYLDCWRLCFFVDRVFYKTLSKKHLSLYAYPGWYVEVDAYQVLQQWKERDYTSGWRKWLDFTDSERFETALLKYLKVRYPIYFNMKPQNEEDPRNFYKATDGRKKFLNNMGDFLLFKQEMDKAFQSFSKQFA